MLTEDLSIFFADMGVPVTWGAYTTTALLDTPAMMVVDGMMINNDYQMTYASASLPNLPYGATITVNGTAYKVKEVKPLDDGAMSVAFLEIP